MDGPHDSAATEAEPVVRLSEALERKLLARLVSEWETINFQYFHNALRRPILLLSDTRTRLGQWHGSTRTLEISRALVLEYAWVEVLEVLKHEITHQYVDEHLRVTDETAHGPTFRKHCERLGIDAAARGTPGKTLAEDDDPASRIVARIHKLLALAQSPNRHEAEAAATTAQRLMLKFNIEVDKHDPRSGERRNYGFRHLGTPVGRVHDYQRRIAAILVKYFFVEGVWISVYRPFEAKRATVFEICGLEPNLAMAEHVHAFLSQTAERLWLEYRRTTKRRGNRDRQAYLSGVMRGFDDKLAEQHKEFQTQGLVWVPQPDLHGFYRRRHPKLVTIRRASARRNEAFADGSKAGRSIVLSQPVTRGGSGRRPKALTNG
jgi:hypothetical protein